MDEELSYDVVVVGGGAAGVAAALAAAATGAHTALVERYGFLGGMATAGMVSTICGVYHSSPTGRPEPVNDGFALDFARRLSGMPGCDKPVRRGRAWVVPYAPFAFACLADELATSLANLDVYLHAYLVGVATAPARVEALRIVTAERTHELRGAAFVDATGDALLAHAAGAATVVAPVADRQLPSLVFVLQHVEPEAVTPGARVALLRTLVGAERAGLLPKGASNVVFGPSPQAGEIVCKLALDGVADEVIAGRDFLTAAEQEGRRRAFALAEFLKGLPGFARAFVSHTAAQVGVREGRRLVGRYELTRDDVLSGRRFPDAVARACWPIELWESGRLGATYEYLEDGQSYDVPLRSLQARDLGNLFAAGRCLSATHEALGSARVIGTCLATGEAAGRHAAHGQGPASG